MIKNKKIVILIGAPGSGKGTQGDLICQQFKFVKISPGEIMRQQIKDNPNSQLSIAAKSQMEKGNLVDPSIVQLVVNERIMQLSSDDSIRGFLFDGYPRNLTQNNNIEEFCAKNGAKIDGVIYFDISANLLIDRLKQRFTCDDCGSIYNKVTLPTKIAGVCDKCGGTHFSNRSDDSEVIIKNRFKVFNEETGPLIQKYQEDGKINTVDASKNIEEIFNSVKAVINNLN